jgi:hypothetical protein
MKRLILVGLVSVVLASIYSSVYACDHSRKVDATASARHAKIIRTYVVGATMSCKDAGKAPVVSFDIDLPGGAAPQFMHLTAREREEMVAPSPLRTAITLGRAFMTTVEAVVGSLLDVASQKTASLV